MPAVLALLLLISSPALLTSQHRPEVAPQVSLTVDSGRKLVSVAAGPFHIPAASGDTTPAHPGASHQHDSHSLTPFLTFKWPTDGWLRGVRLKLTDGHGEELPRHLIHHINLVNLDRRQLFYPAAERTVALGQETEDIHLPATVGIPITSGTEMGVVVAWHNTGPASYHDVQIVLEIEWLAANTAPRPLSVLPLYLDVRYPIGQPVDFDLPTGRQDFSADFRMPIDGRVIAAGGHLHDFGLGLELTELREGGERTLISLGTTSDSVGRVSAVDREYPGIRGKGIKLEKGRTYRMTGSYHNTTGQTLKKGAMVHLILLFAPEDIDDWPVVDPAEKDFGVDVATLHNRR